MTTQSAVIKRYLLRQSRLLLKLVGIPVVCAALLATILVYGIGGKDLLGLAVAKLLTPSGVRRVLIVILGLTFVTWVRHIVWYDDEPPPVWFRRSIWLNVLEFSILIGLGLLAVWAIPRFAAPR